MPVYFLVEIHCPEDRGGYDTYVEKVKPIVESQGGVYLARTEQIAAFTGDWKPDRFIVIRFDSREALDACFASPEYRAIMRLRTENVSSRAIIVEGV